MKKRVKKYYQEAWGIAPHPEATKFLTCGYDGNVILWDGVAHTDLWTVQVFPELAFSYLSIECLFDLWSVFDHNPIFRLE